MKSNHASKPIGIFDSGIGGLTVAHALVNALPHEDIVYFGDTAHMPHGDKSTSAIQAYAVKIAHLLLQQECKLILIACNSASAAAYDLVKEYVGSKAIVLNVIDPVISLLKKQYAHKTVGLIGTRQTVHSGIYKKKVDELNLGIKLLSHPTNLLASAIEEFGDHDVIDSLLKTYLSSPTLAQIDALILACTHYPIIKNRIATHYPKTIPIIDSSETVALAVKDKLARFQLLNTDHPAQKHFYISDYSPSFVENAKLFFHDDLSLEYYPLWD